MTKPKKSETAQTAVKSIPPLKEKYLKEVVPQMMKMFNYKNIMQVPRLEKVVLNMGVGEATQDPKAIESAARDLSLIAGQKPLIRRARKSISAFKLRKGMPVGVKVTLRGDKMWYFLDKLFHQVLPRVRDFRGLHQKMDGRGNFNLGLDEHSIFPEIDLDKIDKIRGLNIAIVTTAETDMEGKTLLKLLGCPFRQEA